MRGRWRTCVGLSLQGSGGGLRVFVNSQHHAPCSRPAADQRMHQPARWCVRACVAGRAATTSAPEGRQVQVPVPGVWRCAGEALEERVVHHRRCAVCQHAADVEHQRQQRARLPGALQPLSLGLRGRGAPASFRSAGRQAGRWGGTSVHACEPAAGTCAATQGSGGGGGGSAQQLSVWPVGGWWPGGTPSTLPGCRLSQPLSGRPSPGLRGGAQAAWSAQAGSVPWAGAGWWWRWSSSGAPGCPPWQLPLLVVVLEVLVRGGPAAHPCYAPAARWSVPALQSRSSCSCKERWHPA